MGALPAQPTAIGEPVILPVDITTLTNYPNPFNNSTTIALALDRTADVKLSIINVNGQYVSRIYAGVLTTGNHTFGWQASSSLKSLSSGIYIAIAEIDGKITGRKLILLR